MKLKRKLFSSMAFVLSLVMLAVSGAIFVHSAQQQSASTSLSVTFSGHQVNCSVEGWYHVKSDANNNTSKVAMVNSSGQSGITFSATDAPKTETLKISNTASENKAILTATQDYVLFTYKVTNTASNGAYGIEVSLSLSNITGSNLKAVKYGTADSLYADANLNTVCSELSTFSTPNSGDMDIFVDDFIVAGNGTQYYHILLQLDDPTLPVTFNPTFTWTINSSNYVSDPSNIMYTLTYSSSGIGTGAFVVSLSYGSTSGENRFASTADSMGDISGTEELVAGTKVWIQVNYGGQTNGYSYETFCNEWAQKCELTPTTTPTSQMQSIGMWNFVVGVPPEEPGGSPEAPPVGYVWTHSFILDQDYTLTISAN